MLKNMISPKTRLTFPTWQFGSIIVGQNYSFFESLIVGVDSMVCLHVLISLSLTT